MLGHENSYILKLDIILHFLNYNTITKIKLYKIVS